MPLSAYIHIPFCKSKCKYCSFVSYFGCKESEQSDYVDTLLNEIDEFYKNEQLKTLYFGGGTPSLLSVDKLSLILNKFKFNSDTEVTIEVNPETVDLEKFVNLKKVGFNRVSIGVQSFDDFILKSIGRIHTSEKAVKAVEMAQRAGFNNISVDFIYGLPNQSLKSFCDDLQKAVKLGVNHISLYGLKIEEGCYFYNNFPTDIADDDLQADMYLAAINLLENLGFFQYEISNFCQQGYESKHNLNYWNDETYYGFGAGAHGYCVDNDEYIRYANYSELKEYKNNYKEKAEQSILTKQMRLEESVFLGFRRANGIDLEEINKKFSIDFDNKFALIIKKYLDSGHIIKTDCGYKFSPNGFLLSNIILADFVC